MSSTPAHSVHGVELLAPKSIGLRIASVRGQHRKYLPYVFTEHGAIMAATLLSSPRAVEVSVYVVRAFVRLRELARSHQELAKRLEELEEKTDRLDVMHENFSRTTRQQLKQVFDALRELMTPADRGKVRCRCTQRAVGRWASAPVRTRALLPRS